MQAVKVLPKWQITIPKEIRQKMNIKVGDALVIEAAKDKLVIKKGKTIFDFAGSLPKLDMTITEMREKAIAEAADERS